MDRGGVGGLSVTSEALILTQRVQQDTGGGYGFEESSKRSFLALLDAEPDNRLQQIKEHQVCVEERRYV